MRNVRSIVLTFIVVFLFSCAKETHESIGISKVYMPQAVTGNPDNIVYLVPSNERGVVKNYSIDSVNNVVNVFLGVSRSGIDLGQQFNVNIAVDSDTISNAISKGLLKYEIDSKKTILPISEGCFSLPSSLNFKENESAKSFYLSLNMDCLKLFSNRVLALSVFISSDDDSVVIDKDNSKTIILIDVDKL